MHDNLLDMSIEDIKNGFEYDKQRKQYRCNICGKEFHEGEIYPIEGRFFESHVAVTIHINKEHNSVFDVLTNTEQKYLGLTDNQKNLLELMNQRISDNDIAKQLGISPSTVRHQKFMFREKAKQAKMYLAVYELAFSETKENSNLVNIHRTATMVDDRYITTNEESEKIIKTYFASLSPLKLKEFPAREKKKIIILRKIMEQFEPGKRYEEKELNKVLKSNYADYPTIRRYLIEYGFMDRTKDCKEYWIK